jgi:hypothetical protein
LTAGPTDVARSLDPAVKPREFDLKPQEFDAKDLPYVDPNGICENYGSIVKTLKRKDISPWDGFFFRY